MESKNIIIGVGVLAIGGYLAYKYFKKPTGQENENSENESANSTKNQTAQEVTSQGLKLGETKEKIQEVADVKPSSSTTTMAGGNTPVKGITIDPNKISSSKAPFVNAKIMKDINKKILTGQIVPLFKKGDIVSVANTFGDSTETYVEGNTSLKLKWDVDVYFPRSGSKINTASGVGGAPQFDGGKTKGHNFPYFY
jgi:hypothetical protein